MIYGRLVNMVCREEQDITIHWDISLCPTLTTYPGNILLRTGHSYWIQTKILVTKTSKV